MSKHESLYAVARISKLYGADGEVVLRLFDTFPEDVNIEDPLFVIVDGLAVPLFFSKFVPRGRDKAVCKFDDLDSDYRISEFIGTELHLSADSLMALVDDEEEEEGFLYEDLVGYTMYDLATHKKGAVLQYLEYKNNPIFIVDFAGVEVSVPACDDIILDIYPDAKVVEADVPEGLHEFYAAHSK